MIAFWGKSCHVVVYKPGSLDINIDNKSPDVDFESVKANTLKQKRMIS